MQIPTLCFDHNNFKHLFKLFQLSIEDVYFEARTIPMCENKSNILQIYMYWISPSNALNSFQDHDKLYSSEDNDDHLISVLVKGTWCLLSSDQGEPFECSNRVENECVDWIKSKEHVFCRALINVTGSEGPGDNEYGVC